MAKFKYMNEPIQTEKMPNGVPYIIGNEVAERFSFYGMRCILVIFMTKYLVDANGSFAGMSDEDAKGWYHIFIAAVYLTPIAGAFLADMLLGKYMTILSLSLVYCLGHLTLALDETRIGLAIGLTLIAVGAGGIKPCVSANVGDQFGKKNEQLLSKVFSYFYFGINFGSFFATWAIPWTLDLWGPQIAFAIPGILMFIATIIFWMGRKKYVHIPVNRKKFIQETFNAEGLKAALKVSVIFVFIAPFWCLFDQTGSSWVLQAEKMDLHFLTFNLLPSQIQAANPLMVMMLIPLFSFGLYPFMGRFFKVTAMKKITIGLFMAAVSFSIPALVETNINGGDVIKFSSKSTIDGISPINLIDGEAEGIGWSSASAPTTDAPEELIIRLRERKAWNVNQVKIYPKTIMSQAEVVAILENLEKKALQKSVELKKTNGTQSDIDALISNADILGKASVSAKKTATNVQESIEIAQEAIVATGGDSGILNNNSYLPKEISVYAGDVNVFDKSLIPDLFSSLDDDKKSKIPSEIYTTRNKWKHLGDITLDETGSISLLDFDKTDATHILVQIKSNYGGDRVKIGEIEVITADDMPEASASTAGDVWPNVAGIGYKPKVIWQILAYLLLTAAEILISITGLEFAYTQAPKKMKSVVMSLWLVSVSVGNLVASGVNFIIIKPDGTSKLAGANYYWFFVGMMLVTAVVFIFIARGYKEKHYIQGSEDAPSAEGEPIPEA